MQLIFATHNQNKAREIQQMLPPGMQVKTLSDVGIVEEIEENGDTISENSKIKADYVYLRTNQDCFADDSGLEVNTLGGQPGVKSARYAAEHGNSQANLALLLDNLSGIADRAAQFRTVITLIYEGSIHIFEGICRGQIIDQPRGSGGFGYDPVFIPEGYAITFAEMDSEEKNRISHRALAFRKMTDWLKEKAS